MTELPEVMEWRRQRDLGQLPPDDLERDDKIAELYGPIEDEYGRLEDWTANINYQRKRGLMPQFVWEERMAEIRKRRRAKAAAMRRANAAMDAWEQGRKASTEGGRGPRTLLTTRVK